ncbi:probable fatty acyl-CoA reductase 4 [Ziziphus jujuba]|uniref:Fatty acyl-CoA reductase n=1 Tax=Ziziphus jujuba TaxID=326968 RepID=A0ABM3ZWM8_ZIZJJ|nr:probable fatty acyl-CoA reductase 4 [Ziziphus jujuba]
MGEICVKQFRENIPLAIIRPTMVTSSYREPFPGWIEGLSDGVIAAYGKGKVKCFLGSPMSILDLIPCDVVINVIMVAMAAHAKKSCSEIIYHIGSSSRNPIYISNIPNFSFHYFTQNPLTDKKGKLVKV